jgi:thiol-disulfide isomerase/thioredoxin
LLQIKALFPLVLLGLLSQLSLAKEEMAPCDDSEKIYKVCQDQGLLYQEALSRAKEKGKILVVVFGAEWCPWCLSLHKMLSDPKFGGAFAKKFVLSDIGLYMGKEKIESGEGVFNKLKSRAGSGGKLEGIPVLALVNPKTGNTVMLDTAPLEKNTKTHKGHDPKKLLAALEKAADSVK